MDESAVSDNSDNPGERKSFYTELSSFLEFASASFRLSTAEEKI